MRWVYMGALVVVGPSLAMQTHLYASQQETRTTPAVERTVYDMRKLAMRPALSEALVHGCSGTLQEVASIHSRRARLSTTQYWDEVAGPSEVQDQISRPQLGRV